MGQNYSTAAADGNVRAGIDIPELQDFSYEKSLGTARFLKTIKARHAEGRVVVKLFVKPLATFPLDKYRRQLRREQEALANVPNAYSYQRVFETERCGYMIRQYMYSSLYDRISTRPFLDVIEKRWIAFQLLYGLRDSHAQGVRHGDIKAENVLVTSYNWVYLADFSSFKPTYLPADNPADFSYFFDTSGRRVCYVAPERFLDAGQKKEGGELTEAMDIFSLGCVIAELFLEGTPLFTLSQLFKYRTGEYNPSPQLAKIEDLEIQSLVRHMISLDPTSRYSADQYLKQWKVKAFPEYFYSFLHGYVSFVTDPVTGKASEADDQDIYGRADERIDRIFHDLDKISFALGYDQNQKPTPPPLMRDDIIPIHLDIPNYQRQATTVRKQAVSSNDGTLIFLQIVAMSLRNTSRAMARVRACELLLAFAGHVTDDTKMDRILPYMMVLLGDDDVNVQVAAIKAVAQLMELVEKCSAVNSHCFPDYILPKMQDFASSGNVFVRSTFAFCLASFAGSAARFLDMTQALRADGALPTADPEAENTGNAEAAYQALFDSSHSDITAFFEENAKNLLTDPDPPVRRAFLRSVSRLCVFFGRNKANDIILSHLNTYLNDKDWILRCAFYETVTGIATYLGSVTLEDYIMPLMVQSLTDPEEFVVEKVLTSLANMAELGLFQRAKIWELVDVAVRFLMHPNLWIRESAAGFVAASAKWIAPADVNSILFALLQPFLRARITDCSVLKILETLKKPLTRSVFDMAVQWAEKAPKSTFWLQAQNQKTFVFGTGSDLNPKVSPRDVDEGAKFPKNKEDEQWVAKLRNIGLPVGDDWKVIGLREYIWRMAHAKDRLVAQGIRTKYQALVSKPIHLQQQLSVTPMTITFEDSEDLFAPSTSSGRGPSRPRNIAEALIDASNSIDKPIPKTHSRLQLRRVASDIRRHHRLEAANSHAGSGASTPQATSPTETVPIPAVNIESVAGSPTSVGSMDSNRALPRRPSKNSLLSRGNKVQTKASAETSTVSTMAYGKVEPTFPKQSEEEAMKDSFQAVKPEYLFRKQHNYDGNDPFILKHLDSIYLQGYPIDNIEFGPHIAPVQKRPIKRSLGRQPGIWKPEGSLVASFGEHTGPINRVCVCPDHAFFITGSDDGTVKVWDSTRLEKNVSFKARQTYRHISPSLTGSAATSTDGFSTPSSTQTPTVKVKSLCFLEDTRTFASAATDGSIHIVKIDYHANSGTKFGKLKPKRYWTLPQTSPTSTISAVWMEHFKCDSNSVLLIATTASTIIALELRTMKILYTLHNPLQHGTITCFMIDRKRNWLLVGTSLGILDMWDLRFQLRLKSLGLPGSTTIHRLSLHPTKGRGKLVLVAGGTGYGEISAWDVVTNQCREVYRSTSSSPSSSSPSAKEYEAWNPDEEAPNQMLSRFSSALDMASNVDRGVRAFVPVLDLVEDENVAGSHTTQGFIVSAGADRKVRYWNVQRPEASAVVSGLEIEEQRPEYTMEQKAVMQGAAVVEVCVESFKDCGEEEEGGGVKGGKKNGGKEKRGGKSAVINQMRLGMMRGHLDSVLDVAFLEVPYGMIVTVDRSGMVFIYQ